MLRLLRPNGEGRIAIVTTCGPDGGGRGQHWREGGRRAGHSVSERIAQSTGAVSVRQNRVVLAPAAGVKSCGDALRPTGRSHQRSARQRGQQSSSPRGDRDISRSNHCAGKAGMFPASPVCRCAFAWRISRTVDRGCQPAPGLPCALSSDERVKRRSKARAKQAARMRRRVHDLKRELEECTVAHTPSLRAQRSNPECRRGKILDCFAALARTVFAETPCPANVVPDKRSEAER
jgi:hypothetical protein